MAFFSETKPGSSSGWRKQHLVLPNNTWFFFWLKKTTPVFSSETKPGSCFLFEQHLVACETKPGWTTPCFWSLVKQNLVFFERFLKQAARGSWNKQLAVLETSSPSCSWNKQLAVLETSSPSCSWNKQLAAALLVLETNPSFLETNKQKPCLLFFEQQNSRTAEQQNSRTAEQQNSRTAEQHFFFVFLKQNLGSCHLVVVTC